MRSISPGKIEGTIAAPHSKSVFQRAIAAALLARGRSVLNASHLCDDDESALRAAQAMGAQVTRREGAIEIAGPAVPNGGEINCGESGLCLRTFAAIASLFDKEFRLMAEGSLKSRPVDMVADPLRALGADCTTSDGLPPLTVRGPVHGGRVAVDGTVSSQFVTGLMIALPRCINDSEISAPGLRSKPYVELTSQVLTKFGVSVDADPGWERFRIKGGQRYRACEMEVEGDWSGAAFMLVAGATAGEVAVTGLDPRSLQPDRRIVEALRSAGADLIADGDALVARMGTLAAFEFDATDCPDLFPPLVALALRCQGTTTIQGVLRLRHKESDRGAALAREFEKLGGRVEISGDTMRISGGDISGGPVDSHGDHRIAMALAIAALNASKAVEIEGDESVNKSYPNFFEDLERTGARTR